MSTKKDWNLKFKQLLAAIDLPAKDAADILQVSLPTIYKWTEVGSGRKIDIESITNKIFKKYREVNLRWWLFDEGQILMSDEKEIRSLSSDAAHRVDKMEENMNKVLSLAEMLGKENERKERNIDKLKQKVAQLEKNKYIVPDSKTPQLNKVMKIVEKEGFDEDYLIELIELGIEAKDRKEKNA